MKILKNIIWMIIISFIIYIVLIFVQPAIADNIAEKLWIKSFNEKIRIIKTWVDIASTKIPTKEELENAYSWAKNKVNEIKWNIDNIREQAVELWKKYEKAKDFIDDTSKKINNVKNSLNDLQKIWEDISNVVNK